MSSQVTIGGGGSSFQFTLRRVFLLVFFTSCCLALASQGYAGYALILLLIPLIFYGAILGITGIAFVLNLVPVRVLRVIAMTALCGIVLIGIFYAVLVWNVQRSERRAIAWVARQGGSVDRNWTGAVVRVRLSSDVKGLTPLLDLRDLRMVENRPGNEGAVDISRFKKALPQCEVVCTAFGDPP